MRKNLMDITEERHTFTATFGRYGTKRNWNGWPEKTILLVDIMLGDKIICDHVWFTEGKQFKKLSLESGDRIEFCARADSYYKGYHHDELDYRLKFPTSIHKLPYSAAHNQSTTNN